jgi:hypothetical protein
MSPPQHIPYDELELHLMGWILDKEQSARVEEHMIGCSDCFERAEAMGEHIATVKDLLRNTSAEGRDDND